MAAAAACIADTTRAPPAGRDAAAARQWQMRRNCTLGPQQMLAMFGALCGLHLLIGSGFWLLGYPAVALWALLELLGIAWALLCYAQHACDRETLVLARGQLHVEQRSGRNVRRASFDAAWVRVAWSSGPHALVTLSQRGLRMDIGRHLLAHERPALARELRHALHAVAR